MRSVLAVLDDLFFTVKIADGAKRAGLPVVFVKTEETLFSRLKEGSSIVVLDLNCKTLDPILVARRLKSESPSTPVIGYVSHVQTDVRQEAESAGCDLVVPRSVFSSRIADLLQQFSS